MNSGFDDRIAIVVSEHETMNSEKPAASTKYVIFMPLVYGILVNYAMAGEKQAVRKPLFYWKARA
jgi:hypothetical protein